MSDCDIFSSIFIDKKGKMPYTEVMIIKNILLSAETYTHDDWVYKDVYVGFSRLYYILDGEAYYEEKGEKRRLQHGHLYLTPVKKCFTLTENPQDKLLHTYTHIVTFPTVDSFTEIEVQDGTPLSDAVDLWRKYISSTDFGLLSSIVQLVLSCVENQKSDNHSIVEEVKSHIDKMEGFTLCMTKLCIDLGYSREHITRAFAAAYHMTPKQYLNARRMNSALSELMSGKKICDVSESVGFSSPYAFSKAFRKYYGLSPEKYLATLRK